jgi:flavodoxin
MKTLIVYFSHTGNNEILAKYLQKRIACDTLRIEEASRRTGMTILLDLLFGRTAKLKDHGQPLEIYSDFIFVAPIWAAKIASPLKSFLLKEKDHVKSYSFISLCGGATGQLQKITNELQKILQRDPKVVKELWINDLLPPDKINTIKYTSGYRATVADLENFKDEIDDFLGIQNVQSIVEHELR